MNKGKIIAVWGSGGSGKTTTAVKLAARLAEEKKEVILVLTDITSPDMNVLLPFAKDTRSMGHLWTLPDCNTDAIIKACVTTNSDYIGILGYENGENVFSYPDYTKENIMEVYLKLKDIADYVIIDCVSEFAYNVLTTVALEMADKVIRLGEVTTKSFSFFDSNLSLLLDSRYKAENHIRVISKEKSHQAKEAALSHYGGVQAVLPFSTEIENQILEGELFSFNRTKELKDFLNGLEIIFKLIISERTTETEQIINIASEEKGKPSEQKRKLFSKRIQPKAGEEKKKPYITGKTGKKEDAKRNPFKLLKKGVS